MERSGSGKGLKKCLGLDEATWLGNPRSKDDRVWNNSCGCGDRYIGRADFFEQSLLVLLKTQRCTVELR